MATSSFSRRLTFQATLAMSVTGIFIVAIVGWMCLHLFAKGINHEAREAAERAIPVLAMAQKGSTRAVERRLEELPASPNVKQTLSTLAIRAVLWIGPNGKPVVADRPRHDERHDPEHQPFVP